MKQAPFRKIVVLGSSALKIGEAGEFDYSGSQAIKAFKEEGIQTVLINPNIATIQTSEHLADTVYFLPIQPSFVEQILQKERPDAIALSFGGQTALNCGLELAHSGTLERWGVAVAGTPISAIEISEDRQQFAESMRRLGVEVPRSRAATSLQEVEEAAREVGFPLMVRAGFALGGLGSGICSNLEQLRRRARHALGHSPQLLLEECLFGWKEIEYEVVRDAADNCITVCNMENLDPLGIHTGESIVVAPSQTLTNSDYHRLRSVALKVIRALGVIGECNIQFALDPTSDRYRVIEVNARLSRSSALASKATAYPLAFVAAKLALGHILPELTNQVTGSTCAFFEPALDYVVVKVPRWDLGKFRKASRHIGTAMKSIGEVMAIGRTFEEALQKALRMLDIGAAGLVGTTPVGLEDLDDQLQRPTDRRIFALAAAIQAGYSLQRLHELTRIDPWFLQRLIRIVSFAQELTQLRGQPCSPQVLRQAKQLGFSDRQIAQALGSEEAVVRSQRWQQGIRPAIKQIDTVAAEYPAQTNFLYLTYHGQEDDISCGPPAGQLILGSGVYRIGSSVEFDWCCVQAARTIRGLGYPAVLINNNPETVSTDFDECDRLYFEELSLETILEIAARERPLGVLVAMGGQAPNNLALALKAAGLPLLGTPAAMIDRAEDRHKFSALLDRLGLEQPAWQELRSLPEAEAFAERVGYPVLVRPSYVLSGQDMGVAGTPAMLRQMLVDAQGVSPQHPVVVTKFIENAQELEFDGVARNGEILLHSISEHIEHAGVHSGDATLVFPPQHASLETIRRIQRASRKIAAALHITGPFNIQFLARDNQVQVIECNLRASRSFPFVSKVHGVNFIDLATRVQLDAPVPRVERSFLDLDHVGVKAPQFSFSRLDGADPILGVQMSSTGEVGCLGDDFDEALLKAMLAVGYRLQVGSILVSTGPTANKAEFMPAAQKLVEHGIRLYATHGTAQFMSQYGIEAEVLRWPLEEGSPNVLDMLAQRRIDLVINVPKSWEPEELANDYLIRRQAVDCNIPLITDLQLARRFLTALARLRPEQLAIKSWDEYLSRFQKEPEQPQGPFRIAG